MVISELVRKTSKQLAGHSRFEAELIVMYAAGLNRTELIADGSREVTAAQSEAVRKMVHRRQNGEPLQYILGETEFMSLNFYVESGVLIPRSDTETLVESVINSIPADREIKILDICTGSGCIGISIAHYRQNVYADLIDISDTAIETAKKNAVLNNVSERVKITKMDILKEYPKNKYDIIISNPPYIETDVIEKLQTEVKDYEPHLALDGGIDGLVFYRRITDIAPCMLTHGGTLAFEIGYNQAKAVSELLTSNFENIKVIKDLCGNDRVVSGTMKG